MLPAATDELFDALPPGSGLWWVSSFAALSVSEEGDLWDADILIGEITDEDDLRVEALIYRFLRRVREEDEPTLLDTLSAFLREHVSAQKMAPRAYFFHLFPFFQREARVIALHPYALSNQGLFIPATLMYGGRSPVNLYFFIEQDEEGTWSISEIQPGP